MHNFPIDLISAEVDNKPVIVTKKNKMCQQLGFGWDILFIT